MDTEPMALNRTNEPTHRLLNRVADKVICKHISMVAEELQIDAAWLSQIEVRSGSDAKAQMFNVLLAWKERCEDATVGRLVELAEGWCRKGFMTPAVWENIKNLVDFDLPTVQDVLPNRPVEGASELPSNDRLKELQELTKQSLRDKPFSNVTGKIWTETPSSMPLKDIFTRLSLLKKNQTNPEELTDITQLLDERRLETSDPIIITVLGQGGIGKTTALKHLGHSWANDTSEKLKKFDFLFHVSLKVVKSNDSIEKIIIHQHKGLNDRARNVQPEEIRPILQGQTKQKVLILFDGHDEYRPGINEDIDQIVTKSYLRNCWVLVTSRETENFIPIKECSEFAAEITGFDVHKVKEYLMKFLGSDDKCHRFLSITETLHREANERGKYGIMHNPFFLHMLCILYQRRISLPKTRTGILDAIVERCPQWDSIRKCGKKTKKNLNEVVISLGKFVLRCLLEERHVFEKGEILEAVGEEAFELGLLMGTESDPMEEEQLQVYCFHHLLLTQFGASKYVATLDAATLHQFFPTWDSFKKHADVIFFACGLTSPRRTLVDCVYQTLLQELKTRTPKQHQVGYFPTDFLKLLGEEVLEFNPLNNNLMNLVDLSGDYFEPARDIVVYAPSRFFVFWDWIGNATPDVQVNSSVNYSSSVVPPAECMIRVWDCNVIKVLNAIEKIAQFQKVEAVELIMSSVKMIDRKKKENEEFETDDDDDDYLPPELKEWDKPKNPYSPIDFDVEDLLLDIDDETGDEEEETDESDPTIPLNGLRFSRNVRIVWITSCRLLPSVFKHIVLQLDGCSQLVELDLSCTKKVPVEIGKVLGTLTNLRKIRMSCCKLKHDVGCAVMSGLGKCQKLVVVELNFNVLTKCLDRLVDADGNPPDFFDLEYLDMGGAQLCNSDVMIMSQVLQRSNKLRVLNLSENHLADSMKDILDCNGYPCLKTLFLAKAELKKNDLVSLRAAGRAGKLMNVSTMSLTGNNLTGCIHDLLGKSGPVPFPSLTDLQLEDTNLNTKDEEILTRRLPNRRTTPDLEELSFPISSEQCLQS